MVRRVLEQGYHTIDNERLITLTIYESGINKETIKQSNQYSKRHKIMIQREGRYEFR